MLAFEQYHHTFPTHFDFAQHEMKQEQFVSGALDSYSAFNSIPFTTETFGNGQQDIKYEMMRTVSQSSIQQTYAEAPPSLLSSASAPSASPSTVGSPQSGFAQPASNQFMYQNQFGTGPTIVYDGEYPYAHDSAHFDHESAMGQSGKLVGQFVGKCADLPIFGKRSPDIPVQEDVPPAPLVSSPQPINVVLKAASTSRSQRDRSSDYAAQISPIATNPSLRKSQDDAVFKSPSTPASAYPKVSSPNARRKTGPPVSGTSQDSFCFSYAIPFSGQPMSQHGGNSQYDFFPQPDGNLIQPVEALYPVLISNQHPQYYNSTYGNYQAPPPQQQQQPPQYSPAPSPAPSSQSYHSFSAPITIENFGQQHAAMRRQSVCSIRSGASPRSSYSNDEESNKGRCPYPDCGRAFKDLKAHMLTHERVRPEKCPIVSCEYHTKGFARKYDKNRHTLTHYRGTMVCGFCPGSGSAAEKSFNRADVFKRHLTSVHGVEQTPPNSRKRSPSKSSVNLSSYCQDATGKCSTCGSSFNNAQDFYEHLDDCVLKVVQREDPAEAINALRLAEVSNDLDVQATLERNTIKFEDGAPGMEDEEDEEDDDEDDEDDEDEEDATELNERSGRGVIKATKVGSNRAIIGGNISKKTSKGLTWSKGGGSIIGKSRKRRKCYPPSWAMGIDKINMKKRVLCVYDGQRRLLKDDMMMHNEFEVRMPLQDGSGYVTDLDLETLKRAEAFHNATPEEKGPWIQEQEFIQEFLQ